MMNWKNIFLLASFNVLVTAPRTNITQGESSCSNENQQEYLEELYDRNFIRLLNFIPTLASTPVHFYNYDIESLINDFYTNVVELNYKKESVEKYKQKMQEIQCVNGLFFLHLIRELNSGINETKTKGLKNLHKQVASNYMFYLTRMLSMLHIAKWGPYPWQIEIFTFVAGLKASKANFESYRDHFKTNYERIENTVFAFVTQCVEASYLVPPMRSTIQRENIYCLVDKVVYRKIDLLYKNDQLLAYAYSLADHYTVPNLMLIKLHFNHEFIYDWSDFNIELKTKNVELRLTEYLTEFGRQQLSHRWELDPIGGNKYNALIAECIHLRIVYYTWFHLYTYHALQSRPPAVNESEIREKNLLLGIWYMLVIPLKNALRAFRFDGNIYWSAVNKMMAKINTIDVEELAAREQFTRNHFCQAAENLGLAKASDVNRQLTKVKVEEDYLKISDSILDNANKLQDYTDRILDILGEKNGAFVRLIVSAEENKTFIPRQEI
ncbi:uncharacterized protein LOC126839660 [Adelges cooleyi]|uniref:uncharacterized protein LOC126839660 n=1 Tax=Adelges cooleyi TaxID=133065 RepID=UPI00217FCDE8|nr:uncharacterized protein LOC126839660 [Adelges cooleyi]